MSKEELLALAKELASLDDLSSRAKDVSFLKREAQRINNRDEDNYADALFNDEFNKYYSQIEKKQSSLIETISKQKEALVGEAKKLLDSKEYKKATEDLNKIFTDFRELGYSTKELDNKLWGELKATRDAFYKAKDAHYAEVKENIAKRKEAKEALIAKIKEVAANTNMKEVGKLSDALMDEWKKIGFAGKEVDDALWNEFNTVRQEIYKKRKENYEALEKVYQERATQKEEIIKKAHVLLANSTFTKEEIDAVVALRDEWKKVGFAGKNKDDALWSEFNTTVNKYFDEMRFYKTK